MREGSGEGSGITEELRAGAAGRPPRSPRGRELPRLAPFDRPFDKPFDRAPCEGATLDDLDFEQVSRFADFARRLRRFPPAGNARPEEVLERLGLVDDGRPTNAAVLLFGRAPQRFLPSSEVRCAHFHGTEAEPVIPAQRTCRGAVFELVDQAVDFVLGKIDRIIGTRAHGARAPRLYEIPPEVVSEAVVNAVAHRDYADDRRVRVILFSDRLEVRNPGRLPPPLIPDELRRPRRSVPGNPLLARALYLADYGERRGTGTLEMSRACAAAGVPEPEFTVADEFVTTVRRLPAETRMAVRLRSAGQTGEARPESKPRMRTESRPEPRPESGPESTRESEPESRGKSLSPLELEPNLQPESESSLQPASERRAPPQSEPRPESGPESRPESTRESEPESRGKSLSPLELEPNLQPESESSRQRESERRAPPQSEPRPESGPESGPEWRGESRSPSEPTPRTQPESRPESRGKSLSHLELDETLEPESAFSLQPESPSSLQPESPSSLPPESEERAPPESGQRGLPGGPSPREPLATRVLRILADGPRGKASLSADLGQKAVSGRLNEVVRRLVVEGLLAPTIPDRPRSRLQRYRLTAAGRARLRRRTAGGSAVRNRRNPDCQDPDCQDPDCQNPD